MDLTKATTHVGLCAGYGGIELGLKRVIPNLRTVALCEIEAFAIANLVAKMEAGLMDPAPIWPDLKTFPWESFRDRVGLLTGGYPCQPFSKAGKRLGTEDPRHLWPFIADGIRAMRPTACFFENVEGHISLGLREVIAELESLGYKATWGIFSACEVGAPHQRKRVFILGVNNCKRLEGINPRLNYTKGWQIQNRPTCIPDGATPFILSDAVRNGSRESRFSCKGPNGSESFSDGESWGTWPSRPGEPQHEWEPPRVVGDTKSKQDGGIQLCGLQSNAQSTDTKAGNRQAQSSLGGDADGTASGLDYAELQDADSAIREDDIGTINGAMADTEHDREDGTTGEMEAEECPNEGKKPKPWDSPQTTWDKSSGGGYAELCLICDNRTDELRLLGNGVVPATAERAFLILAQQLEFIET